MNRKVDILLLTGLFLIFLLVSAMTVGVVGSMMENSAKANNPAYYSNPSDPTGLGLSYRGDCETCYDNHILWTDPETGEQMWQDACDTFRDLNFLTMLWGNRNGPNGCRWDLPRRSDYINSGGE